MADVSGKGIPAAMFMMMSKSMLKTKMMSGYTPKDAEQFDDVTMMCVEYFGGDIDE